MNKKISIALISCLLLISIAFFGLWQHERNSQKELLEICRIGVSGSYEQFKRYRDTGYESEYTYALGNLNLFLIASSLLDEKTIQHKHVDELNQIYGDFVVSPEQRKKHIDEIIEILDILHKDIDDFNGYMKIYDLKTKLAHE